MGRHSKAMMPFFGDRAGGRILFVAEVPYPAPDHYEVKGNADAGIYSLGRTDDSQFGYIKKTEGEDGKDESVGKDSV